jgi:SagB-type dehydrogenase family enzyme
MRVDWPSSILLLLLVVGLFQLSGCTTDPPTTDQPTRAPVSGEVSLPAPRLVGETTLEEAIASRRSVREFTNDVLSWQDLSQLLWAAQGITDDRGLRAAPSAGALYPLEVYVVLPTGAYRYVPARHAAELLSKGDLRESIWQAGLRQDALQDAPAIFVIAAVYERTEAKYGERAERYVKLEAGHAAQNLLLQAVVLKLGAVPIGAFYDDRVQAALSLPADHQPLYLIPVGHPRQ